MPEGSVLRDLVFNYLEIKPSERQLVASPIFQRLHQIAQHGLAFYVYPALKGVDRYMHSLGVAHLSELFIRSCLENSTKELRNRFVEQFVSDANKLWEERHVTPQQRHVASSLDSEELLIQACRIAGLCHDIGHLAFSHASERVVDLHLARILGDNYREYVELGIGKFHEYTGYKLLSKFPDAVLPDAIRVIASELLYPRSKGLPAFETLRKMFEAPVDVDKLEYTLRDSTFLGKDFGGFDLSRILSNVMFWNGDGDVLEIITRDKAVGAIERFIYERYFLYKWVYFHPTVQLYDTAVERIIDILLRGSDAITLLESQDATGIKDDINELASAFGSPSADKYVDDLSLISLFRRVYAAIDTSSPSLSDTEFLRSLLALVVSRKDIAFPLYKNNLQFMEFNSAVSEAFASEVEYKPEVEYEAGSSDAIANAWRKRHILNSMRAVFSHGDLMKLELVATDGLRARGLDGRVMISLLPEFMVHSGEYPILTKGKLGPTETDAMKASPFCQALDGVRASDLGVYVYVVMKDGANRSEVEERYGNEYGQVVAESLGEGLGRLCNQDPSLFKAINSYLDNGDDA